MRSRWLSPALVAIAVLQLGPVAGAQELAVVQVEVQPLAANVRRLLQALDFLGAPLSAESPEEGRSSRLVATEQDANKIQRHSSIRTCSWRSRSIRRRGSEPNAGQPGATLPAWATPVLVKVTNDSTATKPLRIGSPQARPAIRQPVGPRQGDAEGHSARRRSERPARQESLSQRRDVRQPADDGQSQRPPGRVRDRPPLLERGRQTRGDARLRHRPGDAGPRLPRRDACAFRRPACDSGQEWRSRRSRAALRRSVASHVSRQGGARLSATGPATRPPFSSSRSRSTATTATHRPPALGRVHDAVRARPNGIGCRRSRSRSRPRRRLKPSVKLERHGSARPSAGSTAAIITSTRPAARTTRVPLEGVMPHDMYLQVKGEGAQRRLSHRPGARATTSSGSSSSRRRTS